MQYSNQNNINALCDCSDQVTTLAMCWMLRLKNGKILCFTNHDEDLLIDGDTYFAKSGFSASAISSDNSLAVDNMDIEGIIDNAIIVKSEILAGLYNHATISVFLVDYLHPNDAKLKLRTGWLGEIKLGANAFVAEVRGLLQAFNSQIGDVYSPRCRAQFCDKCCMLDARKFTQCNLSVSSVVNGASFSFYKQQNDEMDCDEESGNDAKYSAVKNIVDMPYSSFCNGCVKFVTGMNAGITMEISYCDEHMLNTILAFPYKIQVGDIFEITCGCDKTFAMCCDVYHNAMNFRGEPHIPNQSDILRTVG